jgi:hypothetical protein
MIPFANSAALVFTVALLMVTAYFFLGSVPLLVLKHDNPLDAKFIRSFYNTYYQIAFIVALGTTVSYALSQRPIFAVGAAGIMILAWVLHGKFIPKMDALGTQIQANDIVSIPVFRKIHKTAILINLVQLVAIVSSLGLY